MKSCRLALLAILILVVPVLALADEPAPVRLSLEDCVALALERNLDIAIARLNPKSSAESVIVSESAFDARIGSGLSHSDLSQEPTSTFSSTSQTSDRANISYTDPLMTGGQWSAEFGYNENDTKYPPGSAAAFGLVPLNVGANLTLSFSQPLLKNRGLEINRTQIDQARNSLKISESQFRDRVMGIVEQVESAYWNLVGAQKSLLVSGESLRLAKDFLRQTKIKVDVGTLPPIEITTAEAEVASRDEANIVQESAVLGAEDALRALIRVAPNSPDWYRSINPSDKPAYTEKSPDVEEAIALAMENRSSILEAKLQLKNAELGERWSRNQTRWDLRLDANYTTSGNNFEYVPFDFIQTAEAIDWFGPDGIYNSGDVSLVTTEVESSGFVREDGSRGDAFSELPNLDNTNWTVGVTLGIPLGNRRAKAELARSRLAFNQAALNVDAVQQTVAVEVRQAVREVTTNARRVKSAGINVGLQQKKTDAEQKRYENGLSTAFQVLQFQRDYLQAEANKIRAIIDYMKAVSRLEKVKGTLLDARMITLE